MLAEQSKYHITEVMDGDEAFDHIVKEKPDIALLDVEMPKMTGLEVAKKVSSLGLDVDIVFLTSFSEPALFNSAMDFGAKGYLLKANPVSEILDCIQSVLSGNYYLSPSVSGYLLRQNQVPSSTTIDTKSMDKLTPTEKRVLKLVETMKTSQEMAKEMGVSVKTIQNHRHNICNKLGISGAHALLRFAVENRS